MSEITLPCLSIQQPWAWAFFHAGKDYENRTWKTNFRGIFLIHAGKTFDKDGEDFLIEECDCDDVLLGDIPSKYEMGGIVGIAQITDCVEKSDSKWLFGPYGFKVENTMELPFYPCKGRLNFWQQSYPNREIINRYTKAKDWKYE